MASPKNKHAGNITWIEQVEFIYLGVCIDINEKAVVNLRAGRDTREGLERGMGRGKKDERNSYYTRVTEKPRYLFCL